MKCEMICVNLTDIYKTGENSFHTVCFFTETKVHLCVWPCIGNFNNVPNKNVITVWTCTKKLINDYFLCVTTTKIVSRPSQ